MVARDLLDTVFMVLDAVVFRKILRTWPKMNLESRVSVAGLVALIVTSSNLGKVEEERFLAF